MLLEIEDGTNFQNPNAQDLKAEILTLGDPRRTFAYLTRENGEYLQVGVERPWCVLEWRQLSPVLHQRAFVINRQRDIDAGVEINFTAGPIPLEQDEWIPIELVSKCFEAYLVGCNFPESISWRSINHLLGISE